MLYPKPTLVVVALCVILAGAAGCAGTQGDRATPGTTQVVAEVLPDLAVTADATVPNTLPIPDDYVAPDTRGVRIAPIISRAVDEVDHTKPLLEMEGGTAKLHGTVVGPDGNRLEGATVRLQRFVGQDFGQLDVATDEDGEWHADDLRGGRYRVRAWMKPALATVEPQTVFLIAKDGDLAVDIALETHDGLAVNGALVEAEPRVGRPAIFRGLVTQETVDDNGIVQAVGIPSVWVQLTAMEGLKVIGPDQGQAGPDGFIIFTVACLTPGEHSVVIDSQFHALAIGLPACLDGSIDDLPPDTPTVPVGTTFSVPLAGALPPGTYAATTSGVCGTSYEEYRDGTWAHNVSLDRTIVAVGVTRNWTAIPGTSGCGFRRVS